MKIQTETYISDLCGKVSYLPLKITPNSYSSQDFIFNSLLFLKVEINSDNISIRNSRKTCVFFHYDPPQPDSYRE